MEPLMYLDQVPYTFSYTMGTFPLQNEKQLTMASYSYYIFYYPPPTSAFTY